MKVHLEHSPGEAKTNWSVEETSNNRKCCSSSPRGLETNVIHLRILLLCLLCLCYPSHVFLIFHIFSLSFFSFYLFCLSWKTNWYLTHPGPSTSTMSQRLESLETEISSSLDLRGDLNSLYDTLRLQFFSLNYDLLLEIQMVSYQFFVTRCVQLAIGLFRNCLCPRRIGNFHVSIFFPLFCVQ